MNLIILIVTILILFKITLPGKNINQIDVDDNESKISELLIEDKEKIAFIKEISNQAVENYNKYSIFPSITLAQAILESGWGKSELTKDSNNLFGVKADNKWKGDTISVNTKENYNEYIKANFRVYDSKSDSIKDHAQFLTSNKRYTDNGVFESKDYKQQAKALQAAGYSTVKNKKGQKIYADMLIDLIDKYKLYIFDK